MLTAREQLLTAREYFLLPDNGKQYELVRAMVIEMNMPAPRHGYYCLNIGAILRQYVKDNNLGRVMGNDSGVVTQHEPDTVRGPNVSYYSYQRLAPGPLPEGYLDVVPELVFEVRSPTDRWSHMNARVAEFLTAGVKVACVLDPQTATLRIYRDDEGPIVLQATDEFTLPDLLGDFRVRVSDFLE